MKDKRGVQVNIQEVRDITRIYIKFLREYEDAYKYSNNELVEVFRYCLCILLDLDTVRSFRTEEYKAITNACIYAYGHELDRHKVQSRGYRAGLIQGCIHYIVKCFSSLEGEI